MPSFNTVKKLLKKHHKHVRNISDPAITGGIERESKAARRNAVDLGSRPRHNGTPLCLILEVIAIPRGIETENNRLHELIDSSYWDDGEEDARKTTCAYQYPAQLNGVLYDPFPQDTRTFGDVLAFMHRENINVAGYAKTERERRECENGRCRCLGPMIRDV